MVECQTEVYGNATCCIVLTWTSLTMHHAGGSWCKQLTITYASLLIITRAYSWNFNCRFKNDKTCNAISKINMYIIQNCVLNPLLKVNLLYILYYILMTMDEKEETCVVSEACWTGLIIIFRNIVQWLAYFDDYLYERCKPQDC